MRGLRDKILNEAVSFRHSINKMSLHAQNNSHGYLKEEKKGRALTTTSVPHNVMGKKLRHTEINFPHDDCQINLNLLHRRDYEEWAGWALVPLFRA